MEIFNLFLMKQKKNILFNVIQRSYHIENGWKCERNREAIKNRNEHQRHRHIKNRLQ